jgi:ornithine cyclodeaminase
VPELAVWLDEEDVSSLMTLEDAVEVLAGAYRLRAQGRASAMPRTHARAGDAILHAVGGALPGLGVAGAKTWTHTAGGASPVLVLFSLADGSVTGIVEAFAMGQMRTAATSALGTRILAREDADCLALVGSGKQAFPQAMAIAAVRPLRTIRLFGRDAQKRRALACRLEDALDIVVTEHSTPAQAMTGASIVTLVTRSADPVVTGAMLEPGQHVNAIGSIVASRRELDETAAGRCDVVVADSLEQAQQDAGELRAAVEAGALDWADVRPLDSVIDAAPESLREPGGITLFKAVGLGLSDVALGAELVRRAHLAGAGRPLPEARARA